MSEHDPVNPLATDPSLDGDLRAVLDSARAHEPTPGDLAELQAKLAAALPPGTLPGAPPPPAGPAGAAGGKIALGFVATGVVAAAIAIATRTPSPTEAPPPPPASAIVEAPAPPPPPAPIETTPEPIASASATPPARPAPPRVVVPEATILKQAHDELLRGSPERALALAADHARAYPNGALAQERDVITIEALVRLGRKDEARRKARAFHAAYPGSSHGERIDRLVE